MTIRVLLVDDHDIVRVGLRSILEHESNIEVVGEVGDGREALRSVHDLSPQIVLMDITMPHLNGLEATRQIVAQCPGSKVIGLSKIPKLVDIFAKRLQVQERMTNQIAETLQRKLTPLGVQKATQAIAAAFASCGKSTGTAPADCPQAGHLSYEALQPTWELVGDPTADLAFAADDQAQLVGVGRFQMIMTGGSDPASAQHFAVGGAYSAVLSINGSDLKVSTIKPATGIKPAIRPAGATDEAARQLLTAAFAKCVAATTVAPPDCPQVVYPTAGGRVVGCRA